MTDVNESARYDGRDLAMVLADLRFEREMREHGRYPDMVVAVNGDWVETESYEIRLLPERHRDQHSPLRLERLDRCDSQ